MWSSFSIGTTSKAIPNETIVSCPLPAPSGVYRTIWPLWPLFSKLFTMSSMWNAHYTESNIAITYLTCLKADIVPTSPDSVGTLILVWMCSTAPVHGHSILTQLVDIVFCHMNPIVLIMRFIVVIDSQHVNWGQETAYSHIWNGLTILCSEGYLCMIIV